MIRKRSDDILLKLDRSVPFVDAVFRIMKGTGDEREAVQLLLEAEASCGIKFLFGASSKPLLDPDRYEDLAEPRMKTSLSDSA